MTRLIYWHFKSTDILKDLEINFASNLNIKIEKQEIVISRKKEVSLLTDSIVSLSTILGRNGSGKTTILKKIRDELHSTQNRDDIIILEKDGIINIFNGDNKIKFDKKKAEKDFPEYKFNLVRNGYIFGSSELDDDKYESSLGEWNIAYISDLIDASIPTGSHILEGNHSFNYTPSYLLQNPNEFLNYTDKLRSTINSSLNIYKLISKINQINFLNKRLLDFKFENFDGVDFEFSGFIETVERNLNIGKYSIYSNLEDILKKIIKDTEERNDYEFGILNIFLVIGMNNILDISNYYIDYKRAQKNRSELASLDDIEIEEIRQNENIEYKKLIKETIKEYGVDYDLEECKKRIDKLFEGINILDFYSDLKDENFKEVELLKEFHELCSNFELMLKKYSRYFENDRKKYSFDAEIASKFIVDYFRFVRISENAKLPSLIIPRGITYLKGEPFYYSSGEESLIRLFTNIDSAIERTRNLKNKEDIELLVLLDEPDNSLHPDMQKRLIDNLDKFMANYKGCNIQFIMTTHSPIVASDLFRNNLIVLRCENKNCEEGIKKIKQINASKSFAQNIYKLYKESFIIEDGMIGEFSNRKMVEMYNKIDEDIDAEELEKIEYVIDEIGDFLIRKKFESKWAKKKNLIEEITKVKDMDPKLKSAIIEVLKRSKSK